MSREFHEGWKLYSDYVESGLSAFSGIEYCGRVEDAIDNFTEEMYAMVQKHGNMSADKCKGFVAEVWQAESFNINAVLRNSDHRAYVEGAQELASVDVSTNFGKEYSLKYIGSAELSAKAQAKNYYSRYEDYLRQPRKGMPMSFEEYLQKYGIKNDPEILLKSLYNGQYRLIPTEQFEEAKKYLNNKIKIESTKEGSNRVHVYMNYLETLNKLTDRISDDNGVESIPLDKKSAELIVELCKDDIFDPADFGIDISELITTEFIVQEALKSGYSAAVMSVVLEVSPKVCDAIVYLIRNGEIDIEKVEEIGFAAIDGSAQGFIKGYVSCAITIACKCGKLGKQLINISGNTVASITVLVMNTIKNAYLVATGKMTGREMSIKTEDAAIITISALIGGSLGTVILPQLAVLGYMVGSFVGSVVGSIVSKVKNDFIIALCADSGITFFGLVEQDYTVPTDILKKLGYSFKELKNKELEYKELQYKKLNMVQLKKKELHYHDIVILRRGVIGVRRIGYES